MANRPEDYDNEIEFIQDVVSKYFPVYKTEIEYDIVSVYIKTSVDESLEKGFEGLRKELVPDDFIPYIVEENGEHIIKVKKQEKRKHRSVKANLVMLLITLGTTIIAGAWWWSSYAPAGGGMFSLHNVSRGALFYTLPLMTILGTHEMGHYFMARRHDIKASLPFFLPMAPPLGTIGAFISIREPIPDKKSLLDVGIAGPVAGFIVAVPVSIIGLYLAATTTPTAALPEEGIRNLWNFPIILRGMTRFIPFAEVEAMHPTLFAGWVGFLVTGLNLIPASQLDGGHVVRALFGEKAKYISYMAFAFFIIMGVTLFLGYLVLAFMLIFLGGLKHPPPLNDLIDIDKKRIMVGGVAILLLFVSLHPVPVEQETFSYSFEVSLEDEPEQELLLGEHFNYTLVVENQASNVDVEDGIDYNVTYYMSDENWTAKLYEKEEVMGENESADETSWEYVGEETELNLDKGENRTFRLEVEPTRNSSMKNEITFEVTSHVTDRLQKESVEMVAKIGYGFDAELISDQFSLIEEETTEFEFSLLNRGLNDTYEVKTVNISDEDWTVDFYKGEEPKDNISFDLSFAEKINFTALLRENVTQEPEGELTVIFITVTVESQSTEEYKEFELWGIRVNR